MPRGGAGEGKCRLILFSHSHSPLWESSQGLVLSPSRLSLPRARSQTMRRDFCGRGNPAQQHGRRVVVGRWRRKASAVRPETASSPACRGALSGRIAPTGQPVRTVAVAGVSERTLQQSFLQVNAGKARLNSHVICGSIWRARRLPRAAVSASPKSRCWNLGFNHWPVRAKLRRAVWREARRR